MPTPKPPMVILSGPTAVGKTKLSIALAKAIGGEIISADSCQVYRHMDIGSAKITEAQMQGVPHHMIDILEPWEDFSVAVFKERCGQCLPGIYQRGHIPIVTGGTGFYVQALLRDIDFGSGGESAFPAEGNRESYSERRGIPSAAGCVDDSQTSSVFHKDSASEEKAFEAGFSKTCATGKTSPKDSETGVSGGGLVENGEYRAWLENLADKEGLAHLHQMLREVDPASAQAIHPNNRKRVIRALEFFHLTGEPISRHNEREREKPPAYNACYFVLNDRRERLYEKIGQRVDEMLRQGLVDEVKRLRDMGCQRGMVSMQGLGYKEILAHLDGELSLEEAVETIKRDTRHFAKRQLTWFRRERDILWVDKESFDYDEERILEYMLQELREKGIIASPQEAAAPSIYLFSGPCGCGKSTLTNAWAKKLVNEGKSKQIYVIHGDDFHAGFIEADYKEDFFKDGKPTDVLAWEEILKFNWDCILDTAGRALSRGLDVAVDYVVEDELPLMRQLAEKHSARLYYIVLTADEETIRQRIARRGDVEMTDRALFLKNKLDQMPENQGHLFDSTGKTLEQELEDLDMEKFLLRQEQRTENTERQGGLPQAASEKMSEIQNMYAQMGIENETYEYGEAILKGLAGRFQEIDETAEYNQLKVIKAMQVCQVSEACLLGTTGYGYNDLGRDTLESVYAKIFHTEDAMVRPQITCGTHALALALMSNLRPGDELLSPVGKPYDTLEEVIGIRPSRGSLAEYGITYRQVDLKQDGTFDYKAIKEAITPRTRLVTIQRSKGYQTRPTFSVGQIGELMAFVKAIKPDLICMVDNCYGEFVEPKEPSDVGADMVVGSLIKNPGGGLAPIGGYIAGTKRCVENAAFRLTSPGLGKEVGASLGILKDFYQGLFLAPTVTASALKSAIFAANLYERLGYAVIPNGAEDRHDIIQAVTFGTPEAVIAFCQGIQAAAPVDSHVTPEPWDMPGYDSQVIMAAGAFVSGSSIELSADAPIKPPYAVYFQGGLTWPHGKFGILKSLQALINRGLLDKDRLKL